MRRALARLTDFWARSLLSGIVAALLLVSLDVGGPVESTQEFLRLILTGTGAFVLTDNVIAALARRAADEHGRALFSDAD